MELGLLNVVIRNRSGILFEGECESVSSFNPVGKFNILGGLANFITLIEGTIELTTKTGDRRTIAADNGVCKVKENKVMIFLGIKGESK
jgi:F0F1-type ATP synthase epsilon subunit